MFPASLQKDYELHKHNNTMKQDLIETLFSKFESAASEVNGVTCWSARDIYPLFGYTQWRGFLDAIERAKESCKTAKDGIVADFADVRKIVKAGAMEKPIDDILLTRYACYLVAQNGDPRKPEIAFAQTYFAVQTRKAEIITQHIRDIERLAARDRLRNTERTLSAIAFEHGVSDEGFAKLRSKGDYALFHLNTKQAKARFRVLPGRPLADFLPTVNIKAKDFAAEMTNTNVTAHNITGQENIENEHIKNNDAVRSMMISRGIVPEDQAPAEDIKKVATRIRKTDRQIAGNETVKEIE